MIKIPLLRGVDDYWALLCARPGSKSNSFHPLKEVFAVTQSHPFRLMDPTRGWRALERGNWRSEKESIVSEDMEWQFHSLLTEHPHTRAHGEPDAIPAPLGLPARQGDRSTNR